MRIPAICTYCLSKQRKDVGNIWPLISSCIVFPQQCAIRCGKQPTGMPSFNGAADEHKNIQGRLASAPYSSPPRLAILHSKSSICVPWERYMPSSLYHFQESYFLKLSGRQAGAFITPTTPSPGDIRRQETVTDQWRFRTYPWQAW